ncbi:hypothetical protein FACS1894208_01390 [Clostridia bacterium]|nr:hypothetical protein FACS1894208_01390 [Clostridia bacterium]
MKPILFSTDMVRAILEGRKTQTRRVIKPQYAEDNHGNKTPLDIFIPQVSNISDCAPHQPGDILWVRETWTDAIYKGEDYEYRADGTALPPERRWKPSIHMPREAARLFLRVKNVRAERAQDITTMDCFAEGVNPEIGNEYEILWDELYAKGGCGWDTNPWVWVYEFEKISKERIIL